MAEKLSPEEEHISAEEAYTDEDSEDDDAKRGAPDAGAGPAAGAPAAGGAAGGPAPGGKAVRRKIAIEYISDRNRRHITFSKRKAGLTKKAFELSRLTGAQVLLLVASDTGHVYTFATPKLKPIIHERDGRELIQACLVAPDPATGADGAPAEPEAGEARQMRTKRPQAAQAQQQAPPSKLARGGSAAAAAATRRGSTGAQGAQVPQPQQQQQVLEAPQDSGPPPPPASMTESLDPHLLPALAGGTQYGFGAGGPTGPFSFPYGAAGAGGLSLPGSMNGMMSFDQATLAAAAGLGTPGTQQQFFGFPAPNMSTMWGLK